MKRLLLVLGSSALLFASCETGEVTTSSEFDPLATPGSNRSPVSTRTGYKPATFVHTIMDNVAFFKQRPKGDGEADKTLPVNTELKVISDDGNYVKGELNSGEVGFVLSVQVSDQKGGATPMGTAPGNEFQVYPPVPGSVPPVIDPNVPSIPPTIDPNATTPAPAPVDPNAPPTLENPTPPPADAPLPPVESNPLPPGVGE